MPTSSSPLQKQRFEALSDFRYTLRSFLRFSEDAAREEGITALQYQLLLHTQGFPGAPGRPSCRKSPEPARCTRHAGSGATSPRRSGVLAAAAQKDVDASKLEKGAWVAQNGTQYNFGDHLPPGLTEYGPLDPSFPAPLT